MCFLFTKIIIIGREKKERKIGSGRGRGSEKGRETIIYLNIRK